MGANKPYNYRGYQVPRGRTVVVSLICIIFLVCYFRPVGNNEAPLNGCRPRVAYNQTYPLTKPSFFSDRSVYKIAVISDLDTNSKREKGWISFMLQGQLIYYTNLNLIEVNWANHRIELKSKLGAGGRGMELSELVTFNGKLYSCDDRTGIVYEIYGSTVLPWVILNDGNGLTSKGFKCEWMTVKDEELYVGGLGKEWTTITGELQNYDPMWIKKISTTGEITHVNWKDQYLALRGSLGIHYPGYMIHESAVWSDIHRKWFFMPRRASATTYSEAEDEKKGTNILIIATEDFTDIQVKSVGSQIPTRGFSSFKFLPYTDDKVIVAIKSEEFNGRIASYVTVFTIDGEILLPEQQVDDQIKYEGLEFI